MIGGHAIQSHGRGPDLLIEVEILVARLSESATSKLAAPSTANATRTPVNTRFVVFNLTSSFSSSSIGLFGGKLGAETDGTSILNLAFRFDHGNVL